MIAGSMNEMACLQQGAVYTRNMAVAPNRYNALPASERLLDSSDTFPLLLKHELLS
jgi:hypothetical protein